MKCRDCNKAELSEQVENYRYTESGLDTVVLRGVKVRRCPNCGDVLVSIPRISELHRTIAVGLLHKNGRLTGAEIRFLRKSLGWSGVDFARKFHIQKETVSRWETEALRMSARGELLLRTLVALGERMEDYVEELDVFDLESTTVAHLNLENMKSGWRIAA